MLASLHFPGMSDESTHLMSRSGQEVVHYTMASTLRVITSICHWRLGGQRVVCRWIGEDSVLQENL